MILNSLGKVGPVPEGMSADVALKSMNLDELHRKTKERVLASARSFEEKTDTARHTGSWSGWPVMP